MIVKIVQVNVMKNTFQKYRGPLAVFGLLALIIAVVAWYFNFSGPVVFKKHMEAGDKALAANRLEEAEDAYQEAAAMDLTNSLPYEKLYKVCLRMKDFDKAKSMFLSVETNLDEQKQKQFWDTVQKLNEENPYFVYQAYEDLIDQALEQHGVSAMEATADLQRDMSGLWLARLVNLDGDALPELVLAMPGKEAGDKGLIKIYHYDRQAPLLIGSTGLYEEDGLHEIWLAQEKLPEEETETICTVAGSLEKGFTVYGISTDALSLETLVSCEGTEMPESEEKEKAETKTEDKSGSGTAENPENSEQTQTGNGEVSKAKDPEKTGADTASESADNKDAEVSNGLQTMDPEVLREDTLRNLKNHTLFLAAVNTVEGSMQCMDSTLETLNTLYAVTGTPLLESYGSREAENVVYTAQEIAADLEQAAIPSTAKEKEGQTTWQLSQETLQMNVYETEGKARSAFEKLLAPYDTQGLQIQNGIGVGFEDESHRTILILNGNAVLILSQPLKEDQDTSLQGTELLERWGLKPEKILELKIRDDKDDGQKKDSSSSESEKAPEDASSTEKKD